MKTGLKMTSKTVKVALIITTLMFSLQNRALCQTSGKDYAEIYFYRPQQGLMSGATSVDIKIKMNDKEIGALSNGTMMKYRFYSEGPIKIKCIAVMMNSVIGHPWVINIDGKHGEENHIGLWAYMTGVKGEILTEKKKNKISKTNWADSMNYEEDNADPIIKK